jgi:hypothetical protein
MTDVDPHTITRTRGQWEATARRLESRAPTLAARIRLALGADPRAHPDDPLSIFLAAPERATIEHRTPLTSRRMPGTPAWLATGPDADDTVAAIEAALGIAPSHARPKHA